MSLKRVMQRGSTFFIILLTPFLFPSCMYMMMKGDHQGDGSHSDVAHEKEVQVGKFRVTAIFPPMRLEEETSMTLAIVDAERKIPYTRADVTFSVHSVDSTTDHSMMYMNHGTDSSGTRQMSALDPFKQQLNEGTEKGLYEFSYAPRKEGNCRLTLSVSSIEGEQLETPIFFEITKAVVSHKTSGGMGMMGGGTTLGIVTVAVMAAMMAFTLTR